ncbi:precorrin-6A/cobalt-precorrin-6A reductase [Desulfosporosinus sp. BICA1-9]|uniref:precorrin-6A/cobalt-precorrin-6A reductase n=1 Tax=Desulfosporosinus sp. BICA1-9 TaxID=1531958 RepID=UPI00054C2AB9|nr:precorrin-6A/cobalt-precorrin-6A reductase [Desulfosporosinus sp. BICA1-9]KJS86536.1 MAG: precorrin-6x reductase [Desulfosporosinus sp. BICA1-9]HBW36914.1 cobalt-precorrin-6A/precorrin-6x reductase [Desulfosporosinus sp.]
MILLLGETAAAREISECLKLKRLELMRIQSWSEKICFQSPSLVIDASPPSSSVKFAPLRQWCEQRGIPYLRLERPETIIPASPLIYPVFSWEEGLLQLEQRVGALHQEKGQPVTVFVTTGSHQLESIVRSPFARLARLVVRVLPEGRLVQKCQDMGIPPRDIVAMQGQFSKEVNRVFFKFYGADILLTRDSGSAGGTDTKISAALELGLETVLVKRTKANTGLTVNSVNELLDWVDANIPK